MLQAVNSSLDFLQKPCGMRSVHLGMMELKRNGQIFPEKAFSEFSPYQKRVVENTAVHAYRTVYTVVHKCGSSNYHAFRQVMVPASFRHLSGQLQVVMIEFCQIFRKRNVAGTYLPYSVGNDRIYGDFIILEQPVAYRKHVKFPDA